ncbi:MAG TPA: response regulator, partial [Accumulibacter sp.]|nr:response regulator [Accumulibacter sp.]
MRILTVEDEPLLQTQLSDALRAAGYAVDSASNGVDAHYLGDSGSYDAVVLDLGLPQLDG